MLWNGRKERGRKLCVENAEKKTGFSHLEGRPRRDLFASDDSVYLVSNKFPHVSGLNATSGDIKNTDPRQLWYYNSQRRQKIDRKMRQVPMRVMRTE